MSRHGIAGWGIIATAATLLALPALAEPRPVVVELFTSQGCSSCPPAEELLGELSKRSDVIALAFHVDYWDRLGWRDRFGLAEASARQRAYAQALGLHSIYTPQMVVDGVADIIGSDQPRVMAAVGGRRDGIPIEVAIKDGHLTVDIPAGPPEIAAEVTLVTFTTQAETQVAHGENAGRTLSEYAIVRNVRPLGMWTGHAAEFSVPSDSLPADASGAAILLQRTGSRQIIGATSLALRKPPAT